MLKGKKCQKVEYLLHFLEVVVSIQDPRDELNVPADGGVHVLFGCQIEDSESVDHYPGYDAGEGSLDSRFTLAPLTPDLNLRLAIEHLQLVALKI